MKLITSMDHCPSGGHEGSGGRGRGKPAVKGLHGMRRVSLAAAWLLMLLTGGGTDRALSGEILQGELPKDRVVTKNQVVAKDRVVAKVNGMPIFACDLELMVKAQEKMLRFQLANDPARLTKELAEVKRIALNRLIDIQLLEDEFFRLGGFISKEDIEEDVERATQESFKGDHLALIAELNSIGMSFDKYRELRERMIIVGAMHARIASSIEVTDKMAREYYEKNLQRWRSREAVKLHTLTVLSTTANARMLAESLRTRMINGGDFAEMARENSKDGRADDGGAWPWTRLSDINDAVAVAIAKMKKGDVSEVLEQPNTFIILRVDDIREAEPKPFESVKEEVRKFLMEELARERMENRLCQMREAANIQRMGPV